MNAKIVGRLKDAEETRVDFWTGSLTDKDVLYDALVGLPLDQKRSMGPVVGTDLAPHLHPGWLTSCGVITFEGDPSRLLVRDVGTPEALAVELYAVGACRWCDSPAPLAPPRDRGQRAHDNLAVALIHREPAAGHVCPGVPGLLRR